MRVMLDTSALWQRYVPEPGQAQLARVLGKASAVLVAATCKSEIVSGLNRVRRAGGLDEAGYRDCLHTLDADFAEFEVVAADPGVERASIAALESTEGLRAPQALHVGSAVAARAQLFVTADRRQAEAARLAGLATELIEVA